MAAGVFVRWHVHMGIVMMLARCFPLRIRCFPVIRSPPEKCATSVQRGWNELGAVPVCLPNMVENAAGVL